MFANYTTIMLGEKQREERIPATCHIGLGIPGSVKSLEGKLHTKQPNRMEFPKGPELGVKV